VVVGNAEAEKLKPPVEGLEAVAVVVLVVLVSSLVDVAGAADERPKLNPEEGLEENVS